MRSTVLLVSATLVSLSSFSVFATTDQDTVIEDDGGIITNTFGNCVRSKWQAGNDACAPEAPEPTPAPTPAAEPRLEPDRDQRTVYFEFNRSDLTLESAQKLNALVQWIARAKGVTGATIVGFTDDIGSNDYNQKLSEARAASVQSYLRRQGVTLPTNIEIVKGAGENGSVTQCSSNMPRQERIACLAADRRVEIQFDVVR